MSHETLAADKAKGSEFELSKLFINDPSYSPRCRRTKHEDAQHPQQRASQSQSHEYPDFQTIEQTLTKLKGSSKRDSAVCLSALKKSKRRSASKSSLKDAVPVEKIRTPGLTLQRHKRTSNSSQLQLPSSDHTVASFSQEETPDRPPPATPPPSSQLVVRRSMSENPKASRVRAGRTSPAPIPVTVTTIPLPPDHPFTIHNPITLPPPIYSMPPYTPSPATTANTRYYTSLANNDVDHWTHIQHELASLDIPLDAISPDQTTDLLAITDPAQLTAYLDKLAQIHQADAFEHILPSTADDISNPKLYTCRYTHSAPLGEVYTYRPPVTSSGVDFDEDGGGVVNANGKKTLAQLVQEGKRWGKRSRCAKCAKLGYAVLAGIGVIGAIVAVCYFRVGEGKKSFAHET